MLAFAFLVVASLAAVPQSDARGIRYCQLIAALNDGNPKIDDKIRSYYHLTPNYRKLFCYIVRVLKCKEQCSIDYINYNDIDGSPPTTTASITTSTIKSTTTDKLSSPGVALKPPTTTSKPSVNPPLEINSSFVSAIPTEDFDGDGGGSPLRIGRTLLEYAESLNPEPRSLSDSDETSRSSFDISGDTFSLDSADYPSSIEYDSTTISIVTPPIFDVLSSNLTIFN